MIKEGLQMNDFMNDDFISLENTKIKTATKIQLKISHFMIKHKIIGILLNVITVVFFIVGIITSFKWIIIKLTNIF